MARIEGEYRRVSEDEEALAYLPTNDRTYARVGVLVLVLAFGIFGGWAIFAPLQSAAVAPGKLEVESASKTVEHLEGGIVSRILVESGQRVDKGQTLLRLDNTRARSELEVARSRLWSAQARKARLEAERRGQEQVDFPDSLLEQGVSPRVDQLMMTQRQEFRARRQALESELSARRQRLDQLEQQRKGLQEQIMAKEALLQSYEEEIAERRDLVERDLADKRKLREARRRLHQLQGELGSHRTELARLSAKREEERLNIIHRQRDHHQKVVAELEKAQARILQSRARIISLRDTLDRTRVVAPASGEVVDLQVQTEGGVVKAGEPLMEIVPRGEPFEIRARVQPNDIDRVQRGLKAGVRFPAFTSIREKLPGKVVNISADTVTDQQTKTDYYEARIALTPEGLSKLREFDVTLESGMPAEVYIRTGERTLFEYLLRPVQLWFSRAMTEA